MASKYNGDQEKEEDDQQCGIAPNNLMKLKQLHDKTTMVTKKYDQVKSGYNNVNNVKNKAQKQYNWVKNGKVQPTSSIASQPPANLSTVNVMFRLYSMSIRVEICCSSFSRPTNTMKTTLIVVVVTVALAVPITAGITYALNKCTSPPHKGTSQGDTACFDSLMFHSVDYVEIERNLKGFLPNPLHSKVTMILLNFQAISAYSPKMLNYNILS